ncbi:MAG: pilus assembly PilX family protein [Pontibacterium sp.]
MKQQRGSLLIVTLLLLLIMTLIGMAGIEVTGLEEKMAASMRDRQMAFEAAETALLDGEAYLESVIIMPAFDNSNGLYQPKTDGTNHWDDWAVLGSNVRTMRSQITEADDKGFGQLSVYATYIIEEIAATAQDDSKEAGKAVEDRRYYRITARAQGLTSSTKVTLQSIYKR